MGRTMRIAATVASLTLTGLLATGATALAADRVGPFEFESQCLRAGNQGIEDGRWDDYECRGSNGAWYVYPTD